METKHIQIKDYNYPLPDERIAKYPLPERDASKLLVYRGGEVSESHFRHLPEFLPQGALMVMNNTRVIQARMHFRKETGALIEVFVLEPAWPVEYQENFIQRGHVAWYCLVGNLKKWKEGSLHRDIAVNGQNIRLSITRGEVHGTSHRIDFEWELAESGKLKAERSLEQKAESGKLKAERSLELKAESGKQKEESGENGNVLPSWAEILDAMGELPIPPYLNRDTEESDKQTYQTVYSKIKGSVAAPTAGLHFTERVLQELDAHGIEREEVTLHVGAGTFKPVKSEEIGGHDMHTEHIAVRRQTIERLLAHGGEAIAVGTTSVRTLESLYYMGVLATHPNPSQERENLDRIADGEELHIPQWMPYEYAQEEHQLTTVEALEALLAYMDRHELEVLQSSTQIIIAPGYEYHIVKMMVTNFHQPQSTLLLLVSAFVKGDWHKIYDYALAHDFRFLSYGDSSLLIP